MYNETRLSKSIEKTQLKNVYKSRSNFMFIMNFNQTLFLYVKLHLDSKIEMFSLKKDSISHGILSIKYKIKLEKENKLKIIHKT